MTPVITAQDGFLTRYRQIGLSQREGRPHPQELLQTPEPQASLLAGFQLLRVQAPRLSRAVFGVVFAFMVLGTDPMVSSMIADISLRDASPVLLFLRQSL